MEENNKTNTYYISEKDAACPSIVYSEGEYHLFYIADNRTSIRHYKGESLVSFTREKDVVSKVKKINCLCSFMKSGILYITYTAALSKKLNICKSKDWLNFDEEAVDIKATRPINSFKIVHSDESMYMFTSEQSSKGSIRVYHATNPYIWEALSYALDSKNKNINSPSIIGVNDYQYLIYEQDDIIYSCVSRFDKESGKLTKVGAPEYLERGNNPKVYILHNGKVILTYDFKGVIIIRELSARNGLVLQPPHERIMRLVPKFICSKEVMIETPILNDYDVSAEYEFIINIPDKSSFVMRFKQSYLRQVYVAYNNDYGNVVFSAAALGDKYKQTTKNIGIENIINVRIIFSNGLGEIFVNGGKAAFTFEAKNGFEPTSVLLSASKSCEVSITKYAVISAISDYEDAFI